MSSANESWVDVWKLVIRLVAFGMTFVAIAEVCFRLFIPASVDPIPYYDEATQLYRYRNRDSGVFRRGRLSQVQVPWEVNDLGCVSGEDYGAGDYGDFHRVLLIGDSFIEGLHVEWRDHVASQLQELDPLSKTKVFAFGFSARPFSEHPAVARAANRLSPQTIMCFLTYGDIYISLTQFRRQARSHQLSIDKHAITEVAPDTTVSHVGAVRKFARQSALLRYLVWGRGYLPFRQPVETRDLSAFDDSLQLVCDYVVGHLVEENPNANIVFVVDANQHGIQSSPRECPPSLGAVSKLRIAAEGHNQVYICDLNEYFYSHFMATGKPFSYSGAGHWNQYAHRLAAEYVHQFLAVNDLLPKR